MKKLIFFLPFLILFLPMWQSCEMKKIAVEATEGNLQEAQLPTKKEKGFSSLFDKENSFSGYELIWISTQIPINLTKMFINSELEKEDFNNISFIGVTFSFLTYALISFVLAILSFRKNKEQLLLCLSIVNLCIIIVSYFLFLYNSSDIFKMKYGFYLLTINSLLIPCLIVYQNRRNKKKLNHNH